MTLNSKKQPPHRMDKVKFLYLEVDNPEASGTEYFPYFYAEAKIDFNDVRTGLRETYGLSRALEIYSRTADLLWVDDMVQDIDPQKTLSAAPDAVRLAGLPDFVDAGFISRMETQFTQYLMRSFAATVYRNPILNIYSLSGESRSDFAARCLELFDEPMRTEVDRLQDVLKRRLEQIKEKYLVGAEPVGLEQAKADSRNKDLFSHYSERIAGLFMRRESQPPPAVEPFQPAPGMQELEERLRALEYEARQGIERLKDSYEEKARSLDEYLLHPNLKDIHFVRSCILWMPKKAG
jgi:hypothetical protein